MLKRSKGLLFFTAGLLTGFIILSLKSFLTTRKNYYVNTNNSIVTNKKVNPDEDNYFKYYPMFMEAYKILKKEFVNPDDVTARKLFYGAIRGMISSLNDPYSQFMEPEVSENFNIDMSATFGGLGIHIDIRDGLLTVVSPIEGTPAWRAGLKPDDKIIEIESNSTIGMSINTAISMLRGTPGTKVTITIQREGLKEPFKVTLTREVIKIQTVKSGMIDYNNNKYGYIRITEFSMPTADDFKTHITKLLNEKPKGLIVDLRYNPGGLLNVVAQIVNYFQREGLIVYTKGRLPENNTVFEADKRLFFVDENIPLVVLINGGSASASEIFAGAMLDTGRATLVGTKTFGKGSVQKTYSFLQDGSLIKYTVSKYYTPSGKNIDKTGILPDIEEKMWYESITTNEQDAIIRLQNTNLIKIFIEKNNNFTDQDIIVFQSELSNKGYNISFKSLKWLIKNKKSEKEMPALYDLEFDNQLLKSLEILNDYKKYKKKLTFYKEPI